MKHDNVSKSLTGADGKGRAEAIAEDFFMITLPMPFRLGHVHVFVLVHDRRIALFDTGLDTPETFTALEKGLKAIGRDIGDVERIFVTHYHADHCGMAGRLQALTGAAVHLSRIEDRFLFDNDRDGVFERLIEPFYRRHGLPGKSIQTLGLLRKGFRKMMHPFQADGHPEPYEKLSFGGRVFEALPAPGHTRGQVCFFFKNEGLLLAGDHILPHITPNLSPDLFNPDFLPLESFLASLNDMRELPVLKVYPAHGLPFTNLKGRVDEIEAHHRERTALILASLSAEAKSAFRVSLEIFGEALPEFDQFLALNETYVHIVQLLKEGLVVAENIDGYTRYRRVP